MDEASVREGMRVGIEAACASAPDETPLARISAGNYGGKLGAFQFHLRALLQ
jgi:formylmethanofuran--tetrahydromethanopterin N-formyltransferase